MSEATPGVSRRLFIGGAAAGAAAVAASAAVPGLTAAAAPAGTAQDADDAQAVALDQPVVARVTDLSTGQVTLYVGTDELTVTDPTLARRLARAVRG